MFDVDAPCAEEMGGGVGKEGVIARWGVGFG